VARAQAALGRAGLAETVRTAATGSAGLMLIDPIAPGGPRRAATDRGTADPSRSGVLPAPGRRPHAGVASASGAPMAQARLPMMSAASAAGASAAEAAPKGPSIGDRGDRPGRGEADRPSIATDRPSIATAHLSLVTGPSLNETALSLNETGRPDRAVIGLHSAPAAPTGHSPARAATDRRSILAGHHVRQHGSIAPGPRPVAPGGRSTLLSWVRTRSSSPVAAPSRRPSRPDARPSACSSSRSAARRSNGSCSTRRRCESRSSRSRAGR
jgi:hypothetical protein